MSVLYYPEYRDGTIDLIYANKKHTYNIKYYYSIRGLIIPIINLDNIKLKSDILRDNPDSIICKYPLINSEAETTLTKQTGRLHNTVNYVNYNGDPIISIIDNNVRYKAIFIANIHGSSVEPIVDKSLTVICTNLNYYCAAEIYKQYTEPIYNNINMIINNDDINGAFSINFTPIKEYGGIYDINNGLITEKIKYTSNSSEKIILFIEVDLDGKFKILQLELIGSYGISHTINLQTNKNKYKNIAIFLLVLVVIAAIITPILVAKYKK